MSCEQSFLPLPWLVTTNKAVDHAHLGDSWSPKGQYVSWPNRAQNLKSVALAIPKVFHGV